MIDVPLPPLLLDLSMLPGLWLRARIGGLAALVILHVHCRTAEPG